MTDRNLTDMSEQITILLVEDDDGHAALISKNLRRAGLANPIVRVPDGETALDLVFEQGAYEGRRRPKPMLVLLDLRLPGIDGETVLRTLKEDPSTHKIPIIILTSTDEPREIERCYDLSCNVYVTKPVEYSEFSEAVRRLGMMLAVVQVPNGGF